MGTALPKYLASCRDYDERLSRHIAGAILCVGPPLLLLLGVLPFSSSLSSTLFGTSDYSQLIVASLTYVVGTAIYTALYASYRGSGHLWSAGALQVAVLVVGPLCIVGLLSHTTSVSTLLFLFAAVSSASALPYTCKIVGYFRDAAHCVHLTRNLREMLSYGVPRVPERLFALGLLGIGPFLAAKARNVEYAGFLTVAQLQVAVIQAGLSSIAIVGLPRISELKATKGESAVREKLLNLFPFAVHVGLFFSLHAFLWSDRIVLEWLGEEFRAAIPVFQVLSFAVLPATVAVMLKYVLDAIEVRPINTINSFAAFVVTVVACLLLPVSGMGEIGLACGTALGFATLGFLTARSTLVRLKLRPKLGHKGLALGLNVLLFLLAFCFKRWIAAELTGFIAIILLLVVETSLFAVYCLALRSIGVGWALELNDRAHAFIRKVLSSLDRGNSK